jgi:hypothetical protein
MLATDPKIKDGADPSPSLWQVIRLSIMSAH